MKSHHIYQRRASRISVALLTAAFCLLVGNSCKKSDSNADNEAGTTNGEPSKNQDKENQQASGTGTDTSSPGASSDAKDGGSSQSSFPQFDKERPPSSLSFDRRIELGVERIPPPFIADLLSRQELRAVIPDLPTLEERQLQGRPNSSDYHAIRWAAPESFGISLELFAFDDRGDVREMARNYANSWLEGELVPGSSTKSIGSSGPVRSIYVGDRQTMFGAVISCSKSLCTEDHMHTLGRVVSKRLEKKVQ